MTSRTRLTAPYSWLGVIFTPTVRSSSPPTSYGSRKSNKEEASLFGEAQRVNQELADILGGHSSLMIPGGSDRLSGKGSAPWFLGTVVTSSASGKDSSVMDEHSRSSPRLTHPILTQHTRFRSRVLAVRHSRGVLMALQFFALLSLRMRWASLLPGLSP
ncbi:hypothetical protein EDD16DRAFT_910674 [Pisolithus croceorrhizus]|nr:hypothetical protein EDD16DRAFT_910674 [Pisolithus croceorrhizus]